MHRARKSLAMTVGSMLVWSSVAGGQPEVDPAARGYLSANGLLQRGMNELAAAEYREFLREHPGHEREAHARYGLGVALFRAGEHEEAARALEGLVQLAGFEFGCAAGVLEAQCRIALGDFAAAVGPLKAVIEKHGRDELADDAGSLLVEALYRADRFKEASEAARAFAASFQQSSLGDRAAYFDGLSAVRRGDEPAAAQRFAALSEQWPRSPLAEQAQLLAAQCFHRAGDVAGAERAYKGVIERENGTCGPDAMLGLASLRLSAGDAAAAKALLDALIAEHSGSERVPDALLERGRVLLALKHAAAAREDFAAYGRLDRADSAKAGYWAAKADAALGEYPRAAERLARAIADNSDSELLPLLHFDRAAALVGAGDHREAARALRKFRERFGEHDLAPEAAEVLATVLHGLGEYKESAALCKEFGRSFPDHPLRARVDLLIGENALLAGDLEAAADAYGTFLEQHADDEGVPLASFRLGCVQFRQGRPDEAEPLLTGAAGRADQDEVFRPAVLYLGDLCYQSGRWEEGGAWFEKYIAFGAGEAGVDDALLKLGLCRARLNRHEQAIEAYRQLLAGHPESGHADLTRLELGRALAASGQREAAVEELAVAAGGDDPDAASLARNQLAVIAYEGGDPERAIEFFKESVSGGAGAAAADAGFGLGAVLLGSGRYEEAAEALGAFASEHPDDPRAPEARAQRAIALARAGLGDAALVEIRGALQNVGGQSAALRDSLRFEEAATLRGLGRGDEADQRMRTLLAETGDARLRVHAALELSRAAFEAGRHEQAADVLRGVDEDLASGAADGELRQHAEYQLAASEFKLERFREAADRFENFLKRHPESDLLGSVSLLAGESLFRLGKHGRAAELLQRALELRLTESDDQTARLRLGECFAAAQDWPASERAFSEFIERYPVAESWFQARFGKGWALENQGRSEEAIEEYRKVIEKHRGPTAARAQFQLGECLFAQGKHDEAVRELLKVDILYAYPEWSAAALYEAGRCFEAMGDAGKAAEQYQRVREKHGQTQWARLAGQRLAEVAGKGS